jgi:peptidoglycan/LPS O-acetylase OafA/YrhL
LFPAYFICSLAGTAAWGIFDPDKVSALLKWLAGLTFLPGLFGYEPRLSVYWTLKVEVTFYLWIGVLITLGVWQRYLTAVMIAWLSISLANQLLLGNSFISNVLITDYAGHFCAGIVLYQYIRGQRSAWMPLILGMSWLAFYHYNVGYFSYMDRVYDFAPDARFVPFIPILIVGLVFGCASATYAPFSSRFCSVLGLASYPLYLIHTDVGHWPRMMLDRVGHFHPNVLAIITPSVHMTLAILCSIALSIVIALFVEPRVQRATKWILGRAESS